jgi:hypothetical protein
LVFLKQLVLLEVFAWSLWSVVVSILSFLKFF